MNGTVYFHATVHKILQRKQGRNDMQAGLSFLALPFLRHSIGFMAGVLRRGVRQKQNFRADHAALAGVGLPPS